MSPYDILNAEAFANKSVHIVKSRQYVSDLVPCNVFKDPKPPRVIEEVVPVIASDVKGFNYKTQTQIGAASPF